MSDIWVGLLAVAVGLLFCFRGYAMLRVVLAIAGGLIGWQVGGVVGAIMAGNPELTTTARVIPAVVTALLFAWLAYAFYSAGVTLFMGSIGYGLGTAAGVALGFTQWQLVLIGVSAAVVAVFLSLATNLPRLLLIVLTALVGAAAILGGALSLVGAADVAQWTLARLPALLAEGWWLNLLYLGLALAGIVVQSRQGATGNARTSYAHVPA